VVHAKKIAKMRYIFRISVIRPYREPRGDDGGNCSDHTSYARGDSPSPDCFEPCGFEQIGICVLLLNPFDHLLAIVLKQFIKFIALRRMFSSGHNLA